MTILGKSYLALKTLLRNHAGFHIYRRATPLGLSLPNDLARLVPGFSPRTIIDVGANIGQTALHFSDLWPDARIFSFEPVSTTYVELVSATEHRRSTIQPICLALSDTMGRMQIFLSNNSQLASLEQATIPAGFRTGRTEEVELQTVDHWCQENQLESIDILKIDAEGHDFAVLRGAEMLFSRQAIKGVLIELHFSGPSVDNIPNLLTWLKIRHFRPVALYDQAAAVALGLFYGNVLFVHRSLLPPFTSGVYEETPCST